MRVNVLKIIENLNCRKTIRIAILFGLFLPAAASAASGTAKGSWDQWLDSAYQLTWHDRQDIEKWITEKEIQVFNPKLSGFTGEWEKRVNALPKDGVPKVFPDRALRQLAIAQLLLYLKTSDFVYLEKALHTMDSEPLKAKLDLPEVAFWYYYIKAHYDMEKDDAEGFVQDLFHIWMDVVLKMESAANKIGDASSAATVRGFYSSTPYVYRNLANLILQRAIVKHKLSGIDALGVIIWNLSSRMPSKGYGKWVEHIAGGISGPESDNFRLGFTVQFIESEKKRQSFENLLASGKDSSRIEKSLIDCLSHYEMLYGMAKTTHGRSTVIIKKLQLSSFVLSKLYTEGPDQAVLRSIPVLQRREGNAWHEDKAVLDKAMDLFDALARIGRGKDILFENGFLTQQTYLAAMHELWRAIMNVSLDTALYYDHHIDSKSVGSLQVNIPLLEKALIRYLDFFTRYVNNGYQNIVPDNAYYGAVEAAELLSDIYFLSAQWEKGLKKYDLSLARRIQALEIFPFDIRNYFITAQRLAELGHLEKYKKYVFIQADRIRNSDLIKAYAVQENKYPDKDLARMQATVPEIIMRAPYGIVLQAGLQQVPRELSERLALIEKEIGGESENDPIDRQSRMRISELMQPLKQRLAKEKTHAREEILLIIQDIDPLTSFIEENQISQPQSALDEKRPFGHGLFPGNLHQLLLELKQIKEECILLCQMPDMDALRNKMVLDVNHPLHTLIRELYHANSSRDFNYMRLLHIDPKPSEGKTGTK
ncbi:MAG: hypothetical protein ABIK15_08450 [Pseudomonadota bacterium]